MGDPVHGESITDGDASGGVAVTLYTSGGVAARILGATEVLHVTDVQIMCQGAADVWLCADGKTAGEYVVHGAVDALDQLSVHFNSPYVCAPGTGLTFYGGSADLNTCIIEGFIQAA